MEALSWYLPGGTEEVHEEPQEAGVTAGVQTLLHPYSGLEYYHTTLFGVVMTVIE